MSENTQGQHVQSKPLATRWKWLFVFIASLIGSLVSLTIDGRWPTKFLTFSGVLIGGALPSFTVGMLFTSFIRGWAGVITGIVVVAAAVGLGASSQLKSREERRGRSVSAPIIPQVPAIRPDMTPSQPVVPQTSFVWHPVGSEYKITFSSPPKISEARSGTPAGDATILEAVLMSKVGFQRADFMPNRRDAPITKDTAYSAMASFAHDSGMDHFDVRFNDANQNDIIATLRGTKKIATSSGDVIMAFLAEAHWGRRCVFTAIIGEPTTQHPTPAGMAFLESIRRVP